MKEKQLLTKELLEAFKKQGDTSLQEDPMVLAKYFYPDFGWTWYAIEWDPKDRTFYGLTKGDEEELGYFSLDELMQARGKFGGELERDLYFKPCLLSTLMQE